MRLIKVCKHCKRFVDGICTAMGIERKGDTYCLWEEYFSPKSIKIKRNLRGQSKDDFTRRYVRRNKDGNWRF